MSSDTSPARLDELLTAAVTAFPVMASAEATERLAWLHAVASELAAKADELVGLAQEETHVPGGRLRGEVERTCVQLELFAEVLQEGSYVDAIIDLPDPSSIPAPKPDIRRMLVPIGPVAVYAASNFPFAFSVAGNDTASALAAGCPVILKAHPGHPETSRRTADLVLRALHESGAPDGAFALAEGVNTGIALVQDERIAAAGFTGSVNGGRALFDLATRRRNPIRFFGELGSINPVIVTSGAADERSADIADGFVASFTLGVGQFCTKPGLLFVPAGHKLVDQIVERTQGISAGELLYDKIASGYGNSLGDLLQVPGVQVLVDGGPPEGLSAAPSLLSVSGSDFLGSAEQLLTECFGPTSVLVEYSNGEELLAAVHSFHGTLTTAIHSTDEENTDQAGLVPLLIRRSGRVIWNGWPTGVAVTWAMNHGGPYPATTLDYTSVGATAIHRWLRPVSFQSAPAEVLPAALRSENPLRLVRRVNGTLTDEPIIR